MKGDEIKIDDFITLDNGYFKNASDPYEWQNEKTYIIPELKEKLIEIRESLSQDGRAWLDLELNEADIDDLLKMIEAYEENEGYEL